MRKNISLLSSIIILSILSSSCEVIEGIFKAGFWTGFLLVVVVIVAVILLVASILKKK